MTKKLKKKEPKILIYDIETSYSIMASFSLWPNHISHDNILQEWNMISAAWKWAGQKKVYAVSVADNLREFRKDPTNDYHVVKALRDAIEEADIIVAHNGDKFDIKKLNTRILFHGLKPIGKKVSVDTLKVAKKEFSFTSNRLDYIAKFLGFTGKLPSGNGLWLRALQGDVKAIKEMVIYNKEDVRVLENVYNKLKPYMTNHPNRFLFVDGETKEACPQCGSTHTIKHGFYYTAASKFQKRRCMDCMANFRDKKAIETTRNRGA